MSPRYSLLALVLVLSACDDFNSGIGDPNTINGTQSTGNTSTSTGSNVTTWSVEKEYSLGIDDTVPQQLDLVLNKAEVADLLGPVADDVLLMELDSSPLLTNERLWNQLAAGKQRPQPQL